MKQNVSLCSFATTDEGNSGEKVKGEINLGWEMEKMELDGAEREKETLHFLFSRARINETQKPQERERNISIFESFFGKVNSS